MTESHVISALVAKHSELQGNIKYHQDIILKLKSEVDVIDKTITIFDPAYKTTKIPSKRVNNASYFARGELSGRIIERLKISPSSINEIRDHIFKDEAVDVSFVSKYKQNIYAAITKLANRGVLTSFIDNGIKIYKIAD